MSVDDYMRTQGHAAAAARGAGRGVDKLTADFGTWKTPWGDINRFQRLTGDIVQPFNDAKPSIPVGFTSARWGSLASFGARSYNGTKKMYGTSGNSFVAVVEFGRQRAGQGGDGRRRERRPRRPSTSTIRRSATRPAICARSTSTRAARGAHRAHIQARAVGGALARSGGGRFARAVRQHRHLPVRPAAARSHRRRHARAGLRLRRRAESRLSAAPP